jgi:putative acetyltransferase
MEIDVALDDPRRDDVRRLLERHSEFAYAQSPPDHCHVLDVDALCDPTVTFVTARSNGALVGVGALKELDSEHAELKSMHTSEEARGKGVGRAILDHLLETARSRRYRRVSLETGADEPFAAAQALYESAGFVTCEPFGEYTASAFNVYMTLWLS